MFTLGKLSLIILTRCNLRCRLCCEYVPQNKPFPDMTVDEEKHILDAVFNVADHVTTLHLTGGGEPFLHPNLAEMVEAAMTFTNQFDTLMLFTNSTVPASKKLLEILERYRKKVVVQVSQYGKIPEYEQENLNLLLERGIRCKTVKYYGTDQDFGGWVDFGPWEIQECDVNILEKRFRNCAVTRDMHGNWRTRDGKVHWCSRSQRGMELKLIPDVPEDYVDLFDGTTKEEKQEKFRRIARARYISACDCCSGDQGTSDAQKRYPAAEQVKKEID